VEDLAGEGVAGFDAVELGEDAASVGLVIAESLLERGQRRSGHLFQSAGGHRRPPEVTPTFTDTTEDQTTDVTSGFTDK
jgi:hypothetical protein